jgi:hypothetical protein
MLPGLPPKRSLGLCRERRLKISNSILILL